MEIEDMRKLLPYIVAGILLLAFLYVVITVATGQGKGKPGEVLASIKTDLPHKMAGLSNVFIQITLAYPHSLNDELRVRTAITKELAKRAPGIKIVDEIDRAELTLSYSARREDTLIIGEGLALNITDPGEVLAVFLFRGSQKSKLERNPASNFARRFAEAWIKANKGKN